MHVSTQEAGGKVIFLRKLVAGASRHSFGIHVARMAGMPQTIVERAGEILQQLERQRMEQGIGAEGEEKLVGASRVATAAIAPPVQLSIFESADPEAAAMRKAIEDLDLDRMSPIEVVLKISELKKEMGV
jgi:DNA mismatch repair protein MutS